MISRRGLFCSASAGIAWFGVGGRALAQSGSYPAHTVRWIVPYTAGGATDVLSRLICQHLSEQLGQTFIVENKPGAGSNIGTQAVISAPPDGYTLLLTSTANAINASFDPSLPYDCARSIAPVAGLARIPLVLVVNNDLPVHSVADFIAYAKANPGKLNYASYGYGTAPNMAAELFNMMVGTKLVHVPYHSNFMPDMLSGQVQLAFLPVPLIIGFIRSGKVRALGVSSTKPSDALPGVPPIAQFVPGYAADIWHGIAAPKGTPAPIADKLHNEINAILNDPAMKPKFENLGAEPAPMTTAELDKFIAAEVDKWAKVIKFADIKAS